MFRFLVLSAALATGLTTGLGTGAVLAESPAALETAEQRAERCSIQAGIVQSAIEQRQANRREKRANKVILKSAPIKGTKYAANVDVLVAWIYSIPPKQLNDDTVKAFEQACLGFDG